MRENLDFDPYRDDLWEGWSPSAQDYADLDSLLDESWADYFELVYDPD